MQKTDNIKKLKANVKIEDIIKKDLELKKTGNNYFTACPFCSSKKGFSISLEKQFGHCFRCGETVDVFSYFQKVKGLTFSQAVLEVKKHINSNKIIELRKLQKASAYFIELKHGKNPISKETIKSQVLNAPSIKRVINKMTWIFEFLISDYFKLDDEKFLLSEEIEESSRAIKKILNIGLNEEPHETQERLGNLFKYALEIIELIKNNNCNLSGIVYGLQ